MGLEPRIIPVSAAEAELAGPEAEICQFKVGKKGQFCKFCKFQISETTEATAWRSKLPQSRHDELTNKANGKRIGPAVAQESVRQLGLTCHMSICQF